MTTWGVYGLQGRTSAGHTVAANDKAATRWFLRWRVNGVAKKRTFTAKGYARTFHDQLRRAQLMGWDADERGWPIDPTGAPTDSADSAHAATGRSPSAGRTGGLSFAAYCEQVWWPIMAPTFGDKNMLGHRNNMRTACDLLVYPETDPRCDRRSGARPGDSILLADLTPDDLRRAVIARRSINRRTAAANQRHLTDALAAGAHDITLPVEQASPATVRAFYVTLAMIIKAAASSGHTHRDPLAGVAALAPAARAKRATSRLLPSIEDIFDLADAIATLGPIVDGRPTGDRYRSLILAAGTLGPRPGELVAHRPDWITFDTPTLVTFAETEASVYDTETNLAGRRNRPPKHREEGETRTVPAIPAVADALREHLERGYHSPERTWLSPTGRGHLDWGNLKHVYWRPACEKVFAGTPKHELAAMAPKTLRKAAVTWWLEKGIPTYLAAEWAGHSINVARDYYAGRSATTYTNEVGLLSAHTDGR
ncbi:site-specific integrase [Nocardioides panacisoli]|uniref:site-specific integrase n=1 Tax=Nocardioides panacisoli TaxID=627624 RepID=UPI001C63232E|nr:site-specific integrase [Nocardioides panacisoli]QYJ03508.1 site-specific integrase [Nocardioides panacisoli]